MGLGFLNWGTQAGKEGVKKLLKKSDSTIKGVTPTLGKKETTAYKFKMAKDKLSKNIDKLVRSKNK